MTIHLPIILVEDFTAPNPFLMVKDFSDEVTSVADLRPLVELGIQFQIMFNEQEDLDVVTVKRGERQFLHSSMERFIIDAKRWELLAEQHHHAAQTREHSHEHEGGQSPSRVHQHKEKTRVLASTAEESRKDREKRHGGEVGAVLKAMEALKLQRVTGQISEAIYQKHRSELEGRLKLVKLEKNMPEGEKPSPPKKIEAPSPRTRGRAKVVEEKDPEGARLVIAGPDSSARSSHPPTDEIGKTQELLDALDERFIRGEISEEIYRELKAKYLRKAGK